MCSTNIVLEVCVCVHDIWIGIGRFSIPTCTDETAVTVLMREGQAKLIMLRKANCSDLILYGWMDVHDPCLLLVYAAIFSNIIDQCTVSGTEQVIDGCYCTLFGSTRSKQ